MQTTILGRTVIADVDDGTVAWIRRTWVEAIAPMAVTSGAGIILIRTGNGPVPAAARHAPALPGEHGTEFRRVDDDEFWVIDRLGGEARGVRLRIVSPGVQLTLHGTPFTSTAALDAALMEALAATGMIRLHAAVVTDGVATLALLGPSGRGKSTTAYRAALAGWRVLAEDGCFLDPSTMRVHGSGRAIRLRPEAAAQLRPVAAAVPPGPLTAGRREVGFDALGGRVDSARLTHLVHLSRAPALVPAWERLPASAAVMAMHESAGIPVSATVRASHGRLFAAVVGGTRHLRLVLGPVTGSFPPLPAR